MRKAAQKYEIPHTINRAGSMIGFFFTNEDVVNYEKAKTSNLDFLQSIIVLWRMKAFTCRLPNLKECFCQQSIRMKILKKQLKHVKKLFRF